jgi:asparagine synthase (glutamine-hydrolysing)
MGALAAVLRHRNAPPLEAEAVRFASSGGAENGSARGRLWRSDDGVVGLRVEREPWEDAAWLAGSMLVTTRGGVSVVADATLYGRSELAAALSAAGERVAADAPAAELIAASYRAFGAVSLLRLNGDFAFVLWDAARGELLVGRDFAGTRPLFYATDAQRALAASTLDGIAALGGAYPSFDRFGLAESASGLADAEGRTCYAGVRSVPPGRVLRIDRSLRVAEVARWSAPTFDTGSATSFTDAAVALRDVLRTAVMDRMSPETTAVWMSGGYDSSSVFATARAALAAGARGSVDTISVSYPVGDQGREDEIIERILAHHGATGRWIDGAELPLLGDVASNAERRDEPFAAMYDGFFRAASREARAAGARVALSGHGGDVLFDSSLVYFADLLSGLHLRTYATEWRASREALWSPAQLLEESLAPGVAEWLARTAARLTGRRKERLHEPAPWLRGDVARTIADSGWMPLERRRGESRASAVARWSLVYPFFTKSQEAAAAAARAEGVEYRMPLLDPRVLALAATRPRWERRQGARSKSLLRAAMKGMLPEDVLLPRLYKTGLTRDYLRRCVRREFPRHAEALRRESALADFGVIDPSSLPRAVEESLRDEGGWVAGQLYFTFQTEYWLRAHSSWNEPAPAANASVSPNFAAHDAAALVHHPIG